MLTVTERKARYAAQAGIDPAVFTPRPGAQARRVAHKRRRQGATPARLAARADAAQARQEQGKARWDAQILGRWLTGAFKPGGLVDRHVVDLRPVGQVRRGGRQRAAVLPGLRVPPGRDQDDEDPRRPRRRRGRRRGQARQRLPEPAR